MADTIRPITTAPSARRRATDDPDLTALINSWIFSVEARNLSQGTIKSYRRTADYLLKFLTENGMPTGVNSVAAEHLRAWLRDLLQRTSPGNAALHYRNARVLFRWLIDEGERTTPIPLTSKDRPKVPTDDRPPFAEDEIRMLFATCERGTTFEDRRDYAIMRVLLDTGMRVSGLAGLRYHPVDQADSDVMLSRRLLRIRLKGGDAHAVPIGTKAVQALDRYTRARARHSHADSPWLWLGVKGKGVHRFTISGVEQMMRRRGRQAGVADVHPHRWRRTMADLWLAGDGNLDDLMQIAGWSSITMPLHYTRARRADRARDAHRRHSPGDRI